MKRMASARPPRRLFPGYVFVEMVWMTTPGISETHQQGHWLRGWGEEVALRPFPRRKLQKIIGPDAAKGTDKPRHKIPSSWSVNWCARVRRGPPRT